MAMREPRLTTTFDDDQAETFRRFDHAGSQSVLPDTSGRLLELVGLNTSRSLMGSPTWVAQHGARQGTAHTPRLTAGEVLAAIAREPFEPGEPHTLVPRLDAVLRGAAARLREVLEQAYADADDGERADLLRCVGRLPEHLAWDPLHDLVERGLLAPSLVVRTAAVKALEGWGGRRATTRLARHEDAHPWLQDYVRRVIGPQAP